MEGVGSGTLVFVLGLVYTLAGWDVALIGWLLMLSGAAVTVWGLWIGAASDREAPRSSEQDNQLTVWGYRRTRPRRNGH